MVDGRYQNWSAVPNRPVLGESGDRDSSWTIYSMYSNIARKEDSEMVERCQKDVDGTLIFVSTHVSSQRTLYTNRET
jgi:hypothetical protein